MASIADAGNNADVGLTQAQLQRLDVNGDGQIDINDFVKLDSNSDGTLGSSEIQSFQENAHYAADQVASNLYNQATQAVQSAAPNAAQKVLTASAAIQEATLMQYGANSTQYQSATQALANAKTAYGKSDADTIIANETSAIYQAGTQAGQTTATGTAKTSSVLDVLKNRYLTSQATLQKTNISSSSFNNNLLNYTNSVNAYKQTGASVDTSYLQLVTNANKQYQSEETYLNTQKLLTNAKVGDSNYGTLLKNYSDAINAYQQTGAKVDTTYLTNATAIYNSYMAGMQTSKG